jgi:putative metalloprotease
MAQLLALLLITAGAAWLNWRMGLARMRREIEARALPLADPTLEALIARLGATLGLQRLRARLYDMPAVNGLATPDGEVFLTTGLVQKYRLGALRAEEVASVVAHELGHVALGHHARRMIDWTGRSLVTVLLGVVLSRFIPFFGFILAALLGDMARAGLSRRDEFEADRFASALMLKAGLGVEPQVAMFRKLARMTPGAKPPVWLSSHPDIDARIAAIEANAAAWRRDGERERLPG